MHISIEEVLLTLPRLVPRESGGAGQILGHADVAKVMQEFAQQMEASDYCSLTLEFM